MFGLIPIFMYNESDCMLSAQGLEIIHNFIQGHIRISDITDRLILTNNEKVNRIASEYSIPVEILSSEYHKSVDCYDLLGILGLVEKNRHLIHDDEVIVLHFRAAFLMEGIIKKAIRSFRHSNAKVLTSVAPSEDHPCQLFQLSDGGILPEMDKVYLENSTNVYYKREFYQPKQSSWKRTPDNRLINSTTEEEINGRQDFPEIFEPDGAIVIVNLEVIEAPLDGESLIKDLYGFPLDCHESMKIHSQLDLLHYFVLKKNPCHI